MVPNSQCTYLLGMPPIAQNKLETEAANIRSITLNFKDFYRLVHSYVCTYAHAERIITVDHWTFTELIS